jgi:acyl carrier protein
MLERIKKVLSQYVEINPDEITEQTDLRLDLSLNSLELAQLITVLEEEYDVEIPDRDILSFQVLGDVIAFLQNGKAQQTHIF